MKLILNIEERIHNFCSGVVKDKDFKIFLSFIPLISLFLTVVSTNYYYFFNSDYLKIYELLSYCTGFSLLSLPAYFFIVYKYKFCTYSKIAVWGLSLYVFINIIWFLLKNIFNIDINNHNIPKYFEALSITIVLLCSIYYLTTKKLKK